MKILLLTDGIFPFQLGGMQKHSSILLSLLAEQKVFVHIMHCGGHGYTKQEYLSSLDDSTFGFVSESKIDFPKLAALPGHYIRENRLYSMRLYSEIKDELIEFDLIYAQGFTGSYFIKQKDKHKIPIVVNLHGLEMFQFAANFKVKIQYLLLAREAKNNLFGADFVYSFGGKLNDILERIGIRKEKILQHSNGISKDYLAELSRLKKLNKLRFLFIGRNERRKGFPELQIAIKQLITNSKLNFFIDFVGPIENENILVHPNLTYHGEIRDTEKIIEILDTCDCLICPSYAEGMPTVILEAMARGLAIIATDVGAINRMIDGNGILLAKPNSKDIAAAMKTISTLPEKDLLQMKMKSLELIKEKFLWEQVIQDKIKDFEKIIKKS